MSKKLKLTPWFSGDVKPARPGVYMRQQPSPQREGVSFFAKWDGKKWYSYQRSVTFANEEVWPSMFEDLKWRGLAVKHG